MNITKEWLKTHDSCSDGMDWFVAQNETDGIKLVEKLMAEDRFGWANWLIVRIMTRPQYLGYAIFAAEQVIDIYEAKYPDDNQPRKAIDAARRVLDNDSAKNRAAAGDEWFAARAAWSAAGAAWAAAGLAEGDAGAAWFAAGAAWSAAGAAWSAAGDAGAAAGLAEGAAGAAEGAAWAAGLAEGAAGLAWDKMQRRIIDHGLMLIREA